MPCSIWPVLGLGCASSISHAAQAARACALRGGLARPAKYWRSTSPGPMLEHLRANARRAAMNNIRTVECAAEDLDPAQGRYDAGICRLGLMLFPSRSRTLATVQRLLEPNGRFAALVFTTGAANPFMARPMEALLRRTF